MENKKICSDCAYCIAGMPGDNCFPAIPSYCSKFPDPKTGGLRYTCSEARSTGPCGDDAVCFEAAPSAPAVEDVRLGAAQQEQKTSLWQRLFG